jgi:uncharacterized protein
MKKNWVTILSTAVVLVGMMTTTPYAQDTMLRIGGGVMGGPFYPMAAAIMMVANESIPKLVATVIPGESVSNLKKIDAGSVDMGLTYPVWTYDAWVGRGIFQDKQYRNIRAIGKIAIHPFQLVVPVKSKITSVKDLRNKTLAVGQKGSGTEIHFQRVMEAYGMNWDDVKKAGGKINFVSFGEMAELMKDGRVDCAIFPSYPDEHVMDIEMAFPCKVLHIDQEHVDMIKKKYPGTAFFTVPKGTYKGQDTAATTIGFATMVIAKASMPEDLAYGLTKAIYDNAAKLAKGYPDFAKMTPAFGLEDIVTPLHAGAAKYFQEKGLKIRPEIQPVQ